MTTTLWAAILSVVSAAGYAAAAVVQERLAAKGGRDVPRWCLAVALTATGAGLHVAALHYGAVGVVQALGALTLLFALPLAAAQHRRAVTRTEWYYAGLTVVGLAVLLGLTRESNASDSWTADSGRLVVQAAVCGIALLCLAARTATTPNHRALLFAAASGVSFGVASVLTKTELAVLSRDGLTTASAGVLVTIVGLAGAGQLLGQLAYRTGGIGAPLAMASAANPVVAMIIGIALLDDGIRFGTAGAVTALGAGATAAVGVVGLARLAQVTAPTSPTTAAIVATP